MKQYTIYLLTLLCACQMMQPQHFGLSKHDWQQLSDAKKQRLAKQYWQIKKQHLLKLKQVYSTPYKHIEVKIITGSALMWPDKIQQQFMPIETEITFGTCKHAELFGPGKLQSTEIELCYNGRYLSIDPSHWRKKFANGGLVIARHQLWQQGMAYNNLTSKGYGNLTNASIYIRAL